MIPDMIALGKRAVACKAWRWMPGMRAFTPHADNRVVGDHEVMRGTDGATPAPGLWFWNQPPHDWVGATPDLSDPATLGCLLALTREAYDNPTLTPLTAADGSVMLGHPWCGGAICVGVGPTEAEALVAALEAAA